MRSRHSVIKSGLQFDEMREQLRVMNRNVSKVVCNMEPGDSRLSGYSKLAHSLNEAVDQLSELKYSYKQPAESAVMVPVMERLRETERAFLFGMPGFIGANEVKRFRTKNCRWVPKGVILSSYLDAITVKRGWYDEPQQADLRKWVEQQQSEAISREADMWDSIDIADGMDDYGSID
jgi:hypothetical protein